MTDAVMDTELGNLLDVFRTETAENLTSMEQSLLALEAHGRPDTERLQELLRAAHTVKGNSAIVGYDDLTAAAHAFEDQLELLKDGVVPCTGALVTQLLDAVDEMRRLSCVVRREPETDKPTDDSRLTTPAARRTTLRVDAGRLDVLLDLTGEITIARGRISQLLGAAVLADATLGATLWQLEQLHSALQSEVMELRMVPLGPVLDAQHRTVRDVAVKLDKQVRVIVEGHDVEVDTSIAEQMRDPLLHMVRNAVDHGIEMPSERIAAGKPAMGTITLRASHQAGAVVIELFDDGRGLDRDRIAAKAEARGLVTDAASLSDAQVFAQIFQPGFSTAGEVTAVSGRGVGMDVVQRHVHALRGTIDIASAPGQGTRFTIRLPLTVAIIAGFTVGVADERYVLPLESVEEVLDFETAHSQGSAAEGILDLRGSALPYLRLREVLGHGGETPARSSVVVVRHADRRIGLVVDHLEGDCQAVIKPLSAGLRRLPGISGSTILGNGRVALILNISQLVGRTTCSAQ